ncbi:MAG: ABC transporter substrate-binding protein, partial [Actinomycetota bacterium]|nr:ABC transporter substrate-binding protein [Actinomycetota bacterium]
MKRRRIVSAIAVSAAVTMVLAGCNSKSKTNATKSTSKAAFNAGVGKIFNPSDKKGGTLKYANSGDWDSLDPADTYYAFSFNFIRNYGRSLVVFKSAPGAEGAK